LIGAGIIYQRSVGAAKLCYLKKKIETITDEEKALEGLRKKRTRRTQIKLLVAVVVLSFLLSESLIIAYENNSFLNQTNSSNTSPITSSYNVSDLGDVLNISQNLNNTTNNSVETSTNENNSDESGTVGRTNENILLEIIESIEISEDIKIQVIEDETPQEVPLKPVFDVNLGYSGRVTRGEVISLNADVENSGALAKNVSIEWILPAEFEIVSGNQIELCGDLGKESCYSEIMIKPNLSVLGSSEVKIVVNYEE
jgi:hypothetical protein